MPDPSVILANPETTTEFAELMRCICDEMSIAFSSNDVNRSLADFYETNATTDLAREDGGEELLNRVGDPLGIRFRPICSSFRELSFATTVGSPLLVRSRAAQEDFKCGYFVVSKNRIRGRFQILANGEKRLVSKNWLRRNTFQNVDDEYEWYLPQSSLAFEAASTFHYRTGTKDQPLKPLARLVSMLRPEAVDIRSIVIFSMVTGILSLTLPLAVEAIVNTIAFGRYLQPLIILSLIVFVFLAFRAGINVLMNVVVEYIQRRLFVRFVDDVANRLVRVPLVHMRKYHGPELVNRFFDIVTIQKVTAKLLLETLSLVLQTFIGLGLLAFYHPFLLGYDVGLIVMMTIVLFAIGRGAVRTSIEESGIKYQTAAWLQQIVLHPLTFKFGDAMGFAINRADTLSGEYVHARSKHFRIVIRQFAFAMAMQTVAATVLLGLGGYLVIEKQMTLGQLVAAELIVTVILGSFAKIGKDLESFYDLLASVDKIGKLLDLPVDTGDRLHLARREGPCTLELVDLQFKTGGKTINSKIESGRSVAIVGRSGAGKSRFLETLAGQNPAKNGNVLLNGFRVDSLSFESIQSQVGFLRELAVFDSNVDDNIRLGRRSVSSEMVNSTIRQLGLQKQVSQLEFGLETQLQVSGYPLSTGAAIRLTLARALVARPGLLLIDGLIDGLSDEDIIDVLQRLESYKSDTTFVITTGRAAVAAWADERIELS